MRDSNKPFRPSESNGSPRRPQMVMKVNELASYLRVHRSTIYRLLRTKAIPAFKIGSDWRFNVEAIDTWRLELRGQVDSVIKLPSNDQPR